MPSLNLKKCLTPKFSCRQNWCRILTLKSGKHQSPTHKIQPKQWKRKKQQTAYFKPKKKQRSNRWKSTSRDLLKHINRKNCALYAKRTLQPTMSATAAKMNKYRSEKQPLLQLQWKKKKTTQKRRQTNTLNVTITHKRRKIRRARSNI